MRRKPAGAAPFATTMTGAGSLFGGRRLFSRAWLLGFLCSWPGPVAEAKLQVGVVKVGSTRGSAKQRWKYLGKFTFAAGDGMAGESSYRVKIQASKGKRPAQDVTLTFEAYRDDSWAAAQLRENPCERADLAYVTSDLTLPRNRSWSSWHEGVVPHLSRPHIWSFYLSDCNSGLVNQTVRVQYEMQMLQPDGSHMSMEHMWMPHASLATLLFFTVFLLHFVRKCFAFYRASGSLHPVIWTLGVNISLLYLSQCWRTLHLAVYRSNGRGLIAVEVLSEVLFVIGQMTQTSLFILIGLGYTLMQSKLGDLDVVLPVAFIVAMIHLMLVLIAKFAGDRPDKFHEHEGLVGWFILALQCALYAWFLWAARATTKEGGLRLEPFLKQFAIAGSLYFLAYPVLMLLLPFFAPHSRPLVMSTGLMAFQVLSNLYLTSLFLERNSAYFKVSTLSASILPGGARVGVDKKE